MGDRRTLAWSKRGRQGLDARMFVQLVSNLTKSPTMPSRSLRDLMRNRPSNTPPQPSLPAPFPPRHRTQATHTTHRSSLHESAVPRPPD